MEADKLPNSLTEKISNINISSIGEKIKNIFAKINF